MIPRRAKQTHKVGVNAVEHWETRCEIRTKPKTKIKMATTIRHGETCCATCRDWLEEFTDNLTDEEASAPSGASASSFHEQLHEKWCGKSTVFSFTSQRIDIAKYAEGPTFRGLFAENAPGTKYLEQNILVT